MRFTLRRLMMFLLVVSVATALLAPVLFREGHSPTFDSWLAAVAEQKRSGKPLLVEFVSVTCITSSRNHGAVIAQPEVQARLRGLVVAELWTDRRDGAGHRRLQEERFGAVSVPLYIIVGANGRERARIGGRVTRESFLEFLAQAR